MSANVEHSLLSAGGSEEICKAFLAGISEADALDGSAVAWYRRAAHLLATVVDVSTVFHGKGLFEQRADLLRALLPLPALEAQYLVFHHMFAGRHPNSWPRGAAALHRYFSTYLPKYYLDRLIGEGVGKSTSIAQEHHLFREQLVRAFLESEPAEPETKLGSGHPCERLL